MAAVTIISTLARPIDVIDDVAGQATHSIGPGVVEVMESRAAPEEKIWRPEPKPIMLPKPKFSVLAQGSSSVPSAALDALKAGEQVTVAVRGDGDLHLSSVSDLIDTAETTPGQLLLVVSDP